MLKTRRTLILPSLQDMPELRRRWERLFILLSDNQRDFYDDLARLENLPAYANNTAAVAGGLAAGDFYRTGGDPDLVCVVH